MGVDNPCLLRGGRDPDHQSPSLTYQTVETKNRPQNALTVLPTDADQNLPIPQLPRPPGDAPLNNAKRSRVSPPAPTHPTRPASRRGAAIPYPPDAKASHRAR